MAVNNDTHLYSPKLLCVHLMTMERRLGMKQVYSSQQGMTFFLLRQRIVIIVIQKFTFRWLETVLSTFQDLDFDGSLEPLYVC